MSLHIVSSPDPNLHPEPACQGLSGQSLGPYRVLRLLGDGGMGAVYEGVHELINRRVAIKALHRQLAPNPEFVSRFLTEARATNRVDHPGLVQILDFHESPRGEVYIIMEYLCGETLASRLKRQGDRLPVAVALRIARQLASALAAAHNSGIVHRDLKPDNVMIISDPDVPEGERTKIMDFGLVKVLGATPEVPNMNKVSTHMQTRTGCWMGTPAYMAPEQGKSFRAVDGKADVYSLGVMLYQMLAGRLPFIGEGGELLGLHYFAAPPPLAGLAPEAPASLVRLVHRMLGKDPLLRPSMADVFAEARSLEKECPSAVRPSHGRWAATKLRATLGSLGVGCIMGVAGLALALNLRPSESSSLPRPIARPPAGQLPPPLAPPTMDLVHINLSSEPSGALLLDQDDRVIAATPVTMTWPRQSQRLQARLKLSGYRDQPVDLDLSHDMNLPVTLIPAVDKPRDALPPSRLVRELQVRSREGISPQRPHDGIGPSRTPRGSDVRPAVPTKQAPAEEKNEPPDF